MHRHLKRTDFCLWSAPPAPLAGVVGALLGDDFPRTVYEHNCSGFLQDCRRSDKLIPLAPVVSENILLCGMREVNASLSSDESLSWWPRRRRRLGVGVRAAEKVHGHRQTAPPSFGPKWKVVWGGAFAATGLPVLEHPVLLWGTCPPGSQNTGYSHSCDVALDPYPF